jgi:DNA-binding NarL/FixJ family response regulator
VWIRCDPSVPHIGLRRALRGVSSYQGAWPGNETPALAICCPEGDENLAHTLPAIAEAARGAPVVVFGTSASLPLARKALKAGAMGFLHAHMPPEHIARALRLAEEGEVVLSRDLLIPLIDEARGPDLSALTARQMKILKLVSQGLANAQVARHLYVSESTVKQHLRAAYRIMGVRNRAEASALLRRSKSQ